MIALIPTPALLEPAPGGISTEVLRSLRVDGWDAPPIATKRIGEALRRLHGRPVPLDRGGRVALRRVDDLPATGEHYRVRIEPAGVRLEAANSAGLSRAATTFLKLLEDRPSRLGSMTIEDHPGYRWRGMHLDVCRHYFDVDYLLRYLDLLAYHHFNVFHWHLTEDQGWRLAIEKHPELAKTSAWRDRDGERYGGFYTADDVRKVVDHAASLDIAVVPEIELPGHATAALAAYPQLSCTGGPFAVETQWGIFEDVYCAGNDAVFGFLEDVFAEVCALFPGEYVHVGGDECPKTRWEACPKCRARMESEGLANADELQSWFVRRASDILARHGKRLVGWDEILEGGLAPNATVMSWRGTEGAIAAANAGHDVIVCPTSHCYFDYHQSDAPGEPGAHGVIPLETVYRFDPFPPELPESARTHVLGGQGNVWTERMTRPEEIEYMILPRMCALAEALWSPPEQRSWPNFVARLGPHLDQLTERGYHHRPFEE